MFHYTMQFSGSVPEALERLETSLKEEKFGVLFHLDLGETLAGKGFELNQTYHILEVCNPHEAKRVIEKDRIAGYFLPCKIAVYEEDGQTMIGMPKPTALIAMVDNPQLQEIAADVEKRLIGCIDACRK